MINNKTKYFVIFLFMLIAGMSVAVAVDVNDTTESTHTLTKETTQQTNTNVITSKEINNKSNEIIKNKNTITKEQSRGTVHNLSMNTYNSIFNDDGTLSSTVHCGDTINFTDDLDFSVSSYSDIVITMTIDKSVNIEGNNHTLNLHTLSGFGNNKHLSYFKVVKNFTNITNLHFHNSQIYVNCSNNVTFDHVNVTVTDRNVGQGVGVVSFCNGTANTTFKNSYMNISNNGGFSAMVLSIAENCTIQNNTIIGEASVGNLLNLNVFGTTTNNPNGVTKNTRNKLINNTIIGPSTASMITYAISISGPYNEIINNTVSYGGYGITTRWNGSYDEVTNTTDDEHDISYYGNIYENNKLLNGAKFSAGYYSIIKNNTISGTSNIAAYSNVTNNTFNAAVTINENTTFHQNNASTITVTVNGAYCHIKDSNISTLYLSSNANPTYNCTGNNIGSVTGNPTYLVTCTCGGRTQQTQKLLKKTNTNVKSEDEKKNVVVTITEENADEYYSKFFGRYLGFKNFYTNSTINDADVFILNITYDKQQPIFQLGNQEPNSETPKELILTTDGYIIKDVKSNFNNVENLILTIENVTFSFSGENDFTDKGFLFGNIMKNNITFKNCLIDATKDNSILEGLMNIQGSGVIKFENCTIKLSHDTLFSPESGAKQDFIDGVVINNCTIEVDSEDGYTYLFEYGVPVGSYNTDSSKIKSINITNNNITIKGMKGIKVATNATTLIENNTITTDADYAIEITGNENIVRNNYLVAKELKADNAVLVTGEGNIIGNNTPGPETEFKVISPATANINETTPITIILKDENGNLVPNEEISIAINDNETETKITDEYGMVIYELTPTTSGELTLTIKHEQTTYGASNITVTINVNEDKDAIIEELNNTIKEQEETINTLNETVNNKTAVIAELNDTVNEQAQTITEQAEAISELNDTVNEQAQVIANQTETISELNDTINNQAQVIAEQADAISELNDTINNQAAAIEDLENSVEALTDIINNLTSTKASTITLESVEDAQVGDTITITGTLSDENGYGIPGTVKLLINNGRATVKTNVNGEFTYDYTVTKVGTYNVTASFMGTDSYTASNTTMNFDVAQQDTILVIDEITPVKSGSNVTVTGTLLDANGNPIKGTIKLLINNGRATVKTDDTGVFTYNFVASKVGINNITASYLESTKYLATNTTATVEVTAMDTQIVFDEISSAKKGEKITISGKLVDENGNAVTGTIKLLINNGRATVKTDANGVFTYEYTVTKVGVNNITASYLGANRYSATEATTTAQVEKLATTITLNNIGTVTQKSMVEISGKLADENGKAITGTIKLLINNGRKTVKTDNTGVFTYSHNATFAGENTITANYLESNNYLPTNTTTTFTVTKA